MAGLTMLIDSSSLIYRAFFSTPATVTSPDGRKMNAAYGFLSMLARLVADHDPEYLACAGDADWRPQWRVDLIESYKTHRLGPADGGSYEMAWADEEIGDQLPYIDRVLEMMSVAVISCPGFEAEDVIGALAAKAPAEVAIVSGDRDLYQLVRDPLVKVFYPKRGVSELLIVDEAEIENRYGIPGRAYGDFAILRGDSSDGLPGVKGIGEKTASTLIRRYGSLEAVVEASLSAPSPNGPLAKVAGSLDYLDRATRVVLITGDAPIEDSDIRRPQEIARPEVFELAEELGIGGPVRRLAEALARQRPTEEGRG